MLLMDLFTNWVLFEFQNVQLWGHNLLIKVHIKLASIIMGKNISWENIRDLMDVELLVDHHDCLCL